MLDVELAEHGKRAMMDGQIDDIRSLNRASSSFIRAAWLDSSSLAAADSSLVAELVCTTELIWSMPSVTWAAAPSRDTSASSVFSKY